MTETFTPVVLPEGTPLLVPHLYPGLVKEPEYGTFRMLARPAGGGVEVERTDGPAVAGRRPRYSVRTLNHQDRLRQLWADDPDAEFTMFRMDGSNVWTAAGPAEPVRKAAPPPAGDSWKQTWLVVGRDGPDKLLVTAAGGDGSTFATSAAALGRGAAAGDSIRLTVRVPAGKEWVVTAMAAEGLVEKVEVEENTAEFLPAPPAAVDRSSPWWAKPDR